MFGTNQKTHIVGQQIKYKNVRISQIWNTKIDVGCIYIYILKCCIHHKAKWLKKCGQEKGMEALKKTCDLFGLTCLCSSLFSEPAVTLLLLSTRIRRCPADGQRQQYVCVPLQVLCVGEDGSFKCFMSVCCPATWEQTDHMHGNVGRQALLMAGKRPVNSAHFVWLSSCGPTAPGRQ